MLITAIEKTKKGRYAVFIDGEFVFSADAEVIMLEKITAGRELDEAAFEEIKRAAQEKYLKERALYLMSFKSYTKKELIKKLAEDADDYTACVVADRMEELGLLNDEEYARRCVKDLFTRKKYGAKKVLYELIHKGIDREIAEELIEELAPETDEVLCSIIERKYARYLTDDKGINKTVNALARMGYSYDEIRRAVNQYIEENLFEE